VTSNRNAERLPGRALVAEQQRRAALRAGDHRVPQWTEAEDAAIREGCESGKTWKAIAGGLPGRTAEAVEKRGRDGLGLKHRVADGKGRWTEAEDAALREGFESGKTWKAIAEGLPGRTKKAAWKRGSVRLGLRRHGAEPDDDGPPDQIWM
jgi:hypothetical protein